MRKTAPKNMPPKKGYAHESFPLKSKLALLVSAGTLLTITTIIDPFLNKTPKKFQIFLDRWMGTVYEKLNTKKTH